MPAPLSQLIKEWKKLLAEDKWSALFETMHLAPKLLSIWLVSGAALLWFRPGLTPTCSFEPVKYEGLELCLGQDKAPQLNQQYLAALTIKDTFPTEVLQPDISAPIQKLLSDMVRVPGGTFIMGCRDGKRDGACNDDEKPPHEVNVPDFYIGRYELTQEQWRVVMGSDPPELYNKGCDQCPVDRVSWKDIQEFIQKLNAMTGLRFRLPSEAEWEYAARGGQRGKQNDYLYSGGNTIDEVAWYGGNYRQGSYYGERKTTRPVGGKKPNELGLYDMIGNVSEWCEDVWHENYEGAPTDGSAWKTGGTNYLRVLRGGAWLCTGDCRFANRLRGIAVYRGSTDGFRLARD